MKAQLEQLQSRRDSFRQQNILTVHLLYIQEMILYAKEKCNCTVNKQVLSYKTGSNNDYHNYVHRFELFNSRPAIAGCLYLL